MNYYTVIGVCGLRMTTYSRVPEAMIEGVKNEIQKTNPNTICQFTTEPHNSFLIEKIVSVCREYLLPIASGGVALCFLYKTAKNIQAKNYADAIKNSAITGLALAAFAGSYVVG